MFKPFEQVLVRDHEEEKWQPAIFLCESKDKLFADHPFIMLTGGNWRMCIAYRGNEKLFLGEDAISSNGHSRAMKAFTNRCMKRRHKCGMRREFTATNSEIAELFFDLAVAFIEDKDITAAATDAGISERTLRCFIAALTSRNAASEDSW